MINKGQIINVNISNITILKQFVANLGEAASSFRYFQNRPFEVISNHLCTYVLEYEGVIVGYGHLDKEEDKIWLGIAIRPEMQGNGFANVIMTALIDFARGNAIKRIMLSVDNNNQSAFRLYLKYGFIIFKVNPNNKIMELLL